MTISEIDDGGRAARGEGARGRRRWKQRDAASSGRRIRWTSRPLVSRRSAPQSVKSVRGSRRVRWARPHQASRNGARARSWTRRSSSCCPARSHGSARCGRDRHPRPRGLRRRDLSRRASRPAHRCIRHRTRKCSARNRARREWDGRGGPSRRAAPWAGRLSPLEGSRCLRVRGERRRRRPRR